MFVRFSLVPFLDPPIGPFTFDDAFGTLELFFPPRVFLDFTATIVFLKTVFAFLAAKGFVLLEF